MEIFWQVLFLVLSYLLGAIPTAYLVGKAVKGIDIREHGSKNVGATNAFRCIGKGWGSFVLVFDILKGFLATQLALWFSPVVVSDVYLFFCGVVAILGHNWTVFLQFKGGKGVATTLGVLLGLFTVPILIALGVSLLVIYFSGYVSLGSLVGAALFPALFALLERDNPHFVFFLIMNLLLCALIFWKHNKNISRLMAGNENRISFRKKTAS